MKKLITFVLFLISGISFIQSQSQLGIRNDNFAGINSTLLNPAGYMTNPFNWDVNLVEGHSFILNNYAYYVNSSILSLATSDEPFIYGPNNRISEKPRQGNILEFYEDDAERYAFSHSGIMGPSFFVRINPNHSIGFVSRARFSVSIVGVPNELSYYKYNELLDDESFTLDKTDAGGMIWGEYGLNYLYQKETNSGLFGFGVTLKYLAGYEGAYVFNNTPVTLNNIQGDSILSQPTSVEFGYTTTSVSNSDLVELNETNGSGFAADLGVSFAGGQNNYGGYKWKLGVSLLDVGQVRFTENAENHILSTDTSVIIGGPEYRAYDRIEETEDALRHLSFQALGDSTASLAGNNFSSWLPTAASVQFDYALSKNIFVNTTLVYGIPISRKSVRRATLIGITPRFESRWLGVALPITYFNFDQVRYGLSTRLGPFFIGTDDLGSIISRSDLNGTDFYAGIKLNPLLFGGKGNSTGGNRQGRSSVRCPQF